MCLRRILSSLRIVDFGLFQDALPEVSTEIIGGSRINLPPDNGREFPLYAHQTQQAGCMFRLKLKKHVNIAVRPKVISQYRTK